MRYTGHSANTFVNSLRSLNRRIERGDIAPPSKTQIQALAHELDDSANVLRAMHEKHAAIYKIPIKTGLNWFSRKYNLKKKGTTGTQKPA